MTSPPGYLLRIEHGQLDLHEFHQLVYQARRERAAGHLSAAADAWRAALALWRGPVLGGATGDLVAAEAARLGELRLAALEERIEVELALGRHADLVGEVTVLVAEQPLRDRLRAQLILALYRSGRRADALAVYRKGQELSIEELGLDPGPELRELERKILCADPALLVAGRAELPSSGTSISGQAPVSVSPPLIRAKLAAPVARTLVSRAALVQRLIEGPPRKLTLICAPAGSGKSSLLADWHGHERERRLFGWLSLDQGDNDPTRFWTYLIEALRSVAPKLGGIGLDLLRTPDISLIPVTLPGLLNELTTLQHRVVLALDDYHQIHNTEIHEQLAFLLEHLPPTLEIVIATRCEPPLPQARLRAHGELFEISAAQLRFSEQEANALINDVLGLGLRPGEVTRIWQRTEGWAAGLYLTALTLQAQADVPVFVKGFDDDRHSFDYLAAEVLYRQPATVRDFLLQTSILERLCGPLCDAVTGTSGSRQMLDAIQRSNLFLVPLDRQGGWYRYHHLFGKLLGRELRSRQPELVPTLHRRAAAWYLQAGWVAEAIGHTVAAGGVTDAAELISMHWNNFVQNGRVATVHAWLRTLGDQTLLSDARMCLVRGWASFSMGRVDDVLPWAQASEAAPLPARFRDGTTSIAAGAATLRASYWLQIGDMGQTRRIAFDAVKLERTAHWRAIATNCAGTASYWLGDAGEAQAQLEQTLRHSSQMPMLTIYALGILAAIHADRGEWDWAQEYADAALRLGEEANAAEYWMNAIAHVVQGKVLEHRGKLAEAEDAAARGVELARRGRYPMGVTYALITLAQVRDRLGNRDEARRLVCEAGTIVQKCPDPGFLADKVNTLDRNLSLSL